MVQIKHFTAPQKMPNFQFSRRAKWPWRDKILGAPQRGQKIIVNQSKPILVIVLIKPFTCESFRQNNFSRFLLRQPLKEGYGCARRVPIMIIGQARTGKTSLKKSLKGKSFNPNEGSTEGIETDPSYFKVTTDVWRTGSNSEDTETEPEFLLDRQVAQNIAKGLKEEERLGDPSTSKTKLSVKYFISSRAIRSEFTAY